VLATIRIRTDYEPLPLPQSVDTRALGAHYMVAKNAPLQIDNLTDRKLLYSTEMLQQLGWCNCARDTTGEGG
jgi:hypothetical protein